MRWSTLLLALITSVVVAAESMDAEALKKAKEFANARVVDARGAVDSSQFPVPGSVPFERTLKLPDKRVVVIADEYRNALAAAKILEQENPGLSAVALDGGYEALRTARPEAKLPAQTNVGTSFTIPSDTCQTGAPLQTYEGGK